MMQLSKMLGFLSTLVSGCMLYNSISLLGQCPVKDQYITQKAKLPTNYESTGHIIRRNLHSQKKKREKKSNLSFLQRSVLRQLAPSAVPNVLSFGQAQRGVTTKSRHLFLQCLLYDTCRTMLKNPFFSHTHTHASMITHMHTRMHAHTHVSNTCVHKHTHTHT